MTGPDYRDFDAEQSDEDREPFAFNLGGRRLTAYRPLPGGAFLKLCRSLVAGQWDAELQVAWGDFIEACLAGDDGPDPEFPFVGSSRARFPDALAASGKPPNKLYEVGQWIIERGTARPTQPPSPSDNGSSETGAPSADDSPSQVPASASGT